MLVLIISLTPIYVQAQAGVDTEELPPWSSRILWDSASVQLEIDAPIPADMRNRPTAPFQVEREVELELPRILKDALLPLRIDSYWTFKEELLRMPELLDRTMGIAEQAAPPQTRQSQDLQTVHITYTIRLYPGIASLFIKENPPFPVPRSLGWVPTDDFTGIVIYARDPVPVHGERGTATVRPALFPEIYDDGLHTVLTAEMVAPDVLKRNGVAGYTDSFDNTQWIARVGENPLRILASGVFGKYRTDVLIPEVDADRILSNDHNRQLLQNGRVLFILSSDALAEQTH